MKIRFIQSQNLQAPNKIKIHKNETEKEQKNINYDCENPQ
jgi:hypothetical protein